MIRLLLQHGANMGVSKILMMNMMMVVMMMMMVMVIKMMTNTMMMAMVVTKMLMNWPRLKTTMGVLQAPESCQRRSTSSSMSASPLRGSSLTTSFGTRLSFPYSFAISSFHGLT